jgi:hypothetical protein
LTTKRVAFISMAWLKSVTSTCLRGTVRNFVRG